MMKRQRNTANTDQYVFTAIREREREQRTTEREEREFVLAQRTKRENGERERASLLTQIVWQSIFILVLE